MRASAFEPLFTYAVPPELELEIGTVVRVPLAKREHYGYVITTPYRKAADPRLRAVIGREESPRAFTEEGLSLARWIADTYCCTLADALTTMIYSQAIPRTIDRIIPIDRTLAEGRAGVLPRLLDLLFSSGEEGMAIEEILRHPEARRAADRPGLRKAISRLVALGAVQRARQTTAPAIVEREERRLRVGPATVLKGKKAQQLVALVQEHQEIARAQAREMGFSNDVIARAISVGALLEESVVVPSSYAPATITPTNEAHAAIIPTAEQAVALETLQTLQETGKYAEVLLHGITGSGKTYVYLELIRRIVAQGDRAIVLVPEIALTPQTAGRFEALFGRSVVVFHSALGERERFEAWRAAVRGDVQVVVGARSAVFIPLPRLKVIVVDEAHEATYRQEQNPRYHAVAVARERLRHLNGMLILGSATPLLESYARAKLGHIVGITLRERATQQPLPQTEIIDLAAEARAGNTSIFSTRLVVALSARLRRAQKAVLFVNRRGTAKFVLCKACGFVPQCRRCSLSLTYHRSEGLLRCHLCDAQEPMPSNCGVCGKSPLEPFGLGTERVASELQQLFPAARIIRMDSDTTTKVGDHARLLKAFAAEGDILVGTQMIAKGLDFPTVTLAAVVAADVGLHVADYRASERTFALLTQVAGRSGRSQPGEALIQTYLPEHPAVAFAAGHDYEGFARSELAERRMLHYPPFSRLAYLTILSRERERAVNTANELAQRLTQAGTSWEVLGPAFAPIPRINSEWRLRIALKAQRFDELRFHLKNEFLPWLRKEPGIRYILEIDV